MIKINPFPLWDKLEDVQEFLVWLPPVFSEDKKGFIPIKRIIISEDFGEIEVDESEFDKWLKGEEPFDPYTLYTINYHEFAHLILDDEYLAQLEYNLHDPNDLGGSIERLFNQLESGFSPVYVPMPVKEHEFNTVVENYFLYRKNLDKITGNEKLNRYNCLPDNSKEVIEYFVSLAKWQIEERLLDLKNEYPYMKELPAFKRIEELEVKWKERSGEAVKELLALLNEYRLGDFLSKKYQGIEDDLLLLLVQTESSFKSIGLNKSSLPMTGYYALCYYIGLIKELKDKTSKEIGVILLKLYNTGARKKRYKSFENFKRLHENNRSSDKQNPFSSEALKIYNQLVCSYSGHKFLAPPKKVGE